MSPPGAATAATPNYREAELPSAAGERKRGRVRVLNPPWDGIDTIRRSKADHYVLEGRAVFELRGGEECLRMIVKHPAYFEAILRDTERRRRIQEEIVDELQETEDEFVTFVRLHSSDDCISAHLKHIELMGMDPRSSIEALARRRISEGRAPCPGSTRPKSVPFRKQSSIEPMVPHMKPVFDAYGHAGRPRQTQQAFSDRTGLA